MKAVTLSSSTWHKILRHLTDDAKADDESRQIASAIKEQISGAVKVRSTRRTVNFTAGTGGDLRGMFSLK